MANQTGKKLSTKGCCLVGPGHHGGVGRPHLGLPSHLSRVSLIQNLPLHVYFPVGLKLRGRPTPMFFQILFEPLLRPCLLSCGVRCSSKICIWGIGRSPHTWEFLCPELQRQENIKCRCPAGENTPAGLKHIYFIKGSFFIHMREGKLTSLGTFTMIQKQVKTN